MTTIPLPINRELAFRLRAAIDGAGDDFEVLLKTVAPIWIRTTHGDGYNPARPWIRLPIDEDLHRAWGDTRMSGRKAYFNLNALLDRIDRALRRARHPDGTPLRLGEIVEALEGKGDVEIRIRLSGLLVD